MKKLTIIEPCPKCGTVPTEYTNVEGFVLEENYIIYCPKCNFSCDTKEVYPTDALIAWNRCAEVNRHRDELKPCPFCGGTELQIQHKNSFYIICTECGIKLGFFKAPQEAIDAWNKRTVLDPLALPNRTGENIDENLCEGEEK